jgi:hypothetical protein
MKKRSQLRAGKNRTKIATGASIFIDGQYLCAVCVCFATSYFGRAVQLTSNMNTSATNKTRSKCSDAHTCSPLFMYMYSKTFPGRSVAREQRICNRCTVAQWFRPRQQKLDVPEALATAETVT